MKKQLVLFFLGILMVTCTSKEFPNLKGEYNTHFFNVEKINGDSLVTETHFLITDSIIVVDSYDDIEAVGDTLILVSSSEPYLHLFSKKTNRIIWEGINHGKGPVEFLGIREINYNSFQKKLNIYDMHQRFIVTISLNDLVNNKHDNAEYYQIPKNLGMVSDFTSSARGYYVVGYFYNQSRYAYLPFKDSSKIQWLGALPEPKRTFAPQVYQQANRGFVDKVEGMDKLAIVYRYSNLLQIYSTEGSLESICIEENYFPPKFTSTDLGSYEVFTQSDDIRFGFTDIETDQDYIYTLYSGAQKGEKDAVFAKYLLIFDWQGNNILSYRLKESAFHIIKEDKNPILYLKHPYKENLVTKISLSL